MTELTKEISRNADDLQLAYELHWAKKRPIRSRVSLFIGCLCLLMGALLGIREGGVLVFLGIGNIAVYMYYYKMTGRRLAKKMSNLTQVEKTVFTDKGIHVESVSGAGETLWAAYEDAVISDKMILLYSNQLTFHFFPKRVFTDDEFNVLKEMVKKNLKKVIE